MGWDEGIKKRRMRYKQMPCYLLIAFSWKGYSVNKIFDFISWKSSFLVSLIFLFYSVVIVFSLLALDTVMRSVHIATIKIFSGGRGISLCARKNISFTKF